MKLESELIFGESKLNVQNICTCCSGDLIEFGHSEKIKVKKCSSCKTFFAKHHLEVKTSYWSSPTLNSTYLNALQMRRELQAQQILKICLKNKLQGPFLDYGCGGGAYLNYLLKNDHEAYGCDVDLSRAKSISPDRLFPVEPWGWPKDLDDKIKTVFLLDVVEHCEDLPKFIRSLRQHGVSGFVCKIPVAHGPLFILATWLFKLGIPSFFEGLFQVGDSDPHVIYFSRAGLNQLFAQEGFALKGRRPIAEVGSELSKRIRLKRTIFGIGLSMAAHVFGALIERMGQYWSDSEIFIYN